MFGQKSEAIDSDFDRTNQAGFRVYEEGNYLMKEVFEIFFFTFFAFPVW